MGPPGHTRARVEVIKDVDHEVPRSIGTVRGGADEMLAQSGVMSVWRPLHESAPYLTEWGRIAYLPSGLKVKDSCAGHGR